MRRLLPSNWIAPRTARTSPGAHAEAAWHAYHGAAQALLVATLFVSLFTDAYLLMVALCCLSQWASVASRRAYQLHLRSVENDGYLARVIYHMVRKRLESDRDEPPDSTPLGEWRPT